MLKCIRVRIGARSRPMIFRPAKCLKETRLLSIIIIIFDGVSIIKSKPYNGPWNWSENEIFSFFCSQNLTFILILMLLFKFEITSQTWPVGQFAFFCNSLDSVIFALWTLIVPIKISRSMNAFGTLFEQTGCNSSLDIKLTTVATQNVQLQQCASKWSKGAAMSTCSDMCSGDLVEECVNRGRIAGVCEFQDEA